MTKRAKLPGADELFGAKAKHETPSDQEERSGVAESAKVLGDKEPRGQIDREPDLESASAPRQLEDSSLKTQVAEAPRRLVSKSSRVAKKPVHDEKVTYYCTFEELTQLEEARLLLRRELGIVTDRGGLIRAAVRNALAELGQKGRSSSLARSLTGGVDVT